MRPSTHFDAAPSLGFEAAYLRYRGREGPGNRLLLPGYREKYGRPIQEWLGLAADRLAGQKTVPLRRPQTPAILHSMNQAAMERRHRNGRRLARAAVSLGATAGLAYLLFFAVYLAVIQCGDNCSDGYTGDWRYKAQLVLATTGVVLGLLAVGLGFTRRTRTYRALLALAVGCVLGWLLWVFGLWDF